MATESVYVVVSGPPASGKSTLATVLARELGLPLAANDTIKDALMSVLPVPNVQTSRQLGRGAVAAMLAVAADSPIGAVIESNFYRPIAGQNLGNCPVQSSKSSAVARRRSRYSGTGAAPEVAKPVAAGSGRPVARAQWP